MNVCHLEVYFNREYVLLFLNTSFRDLVSRDDYYSRKRDIGHTVWLQYRLSNLFLKEYPSEARTAP